MTVLLDDVAAAVLVRGMSPRTARAYVYWVRRFVLFHGKRHPRDLRTADVEAFVRALGVERRLSASSRNQALSALRFLYDHALGLQLEGLDQL